MKPIAFPKGDTFSSLAYGKQILLCRSIKKDQNVHSYDMNYFDTLVSFNIFSNIIVWALIFSFILEKYKPFCNNSVKLFIQRDSTCTVVYIFFRNIVLRKQVGDQVIFKVERILILVKKVDLVHSRC